MGVCRPSGSKICRARGLTCPLDVRSIIPISQESGGHQMGMSRRTGRYGLGAFAFLAVVLMLLSGTAGNASAEGKEETHQLNLYLDHIIIDQPALDDEIKIQIVTGIDALGRGQELQALRGAVTDTVQLLGEQALAGMHISELVSRIFYGYGAKPEGVIKTPAELEEERRQAELAAQQEQARQVAQQIAPQVVRGEQEAAAAEAAAQ